MLPLDPQAVWVRSLFCEVKLGSGALKYHFFFL